MNCASLAWAQITELLQAKIQKRNGDGSSYKDAI
jgi:hypothetical protein